MFSAELFYFSYFQFFLFIVASTLPVPSGNFVPVFKMGAALGRLIGEVMHLWFPYGISFSGDRWPVVPGMYFFSLSQWFSGFTFRSLFVSSMSHFVHEHV